MVVIDHEGVDLPSLQAARDRAITEAREIACAEVSEGYLNLKHRIDIADETGKVLLRLEFKDSIELEC